MLRQYYPELGEKQIHETTAKNNYFINICMFINRMYKNFKG